MPPQDNRDVLSRPEWFKWYAKDWMNATRYWEADQCGWYHALLMWAAMQGNPPGYLPSDEDELKEIAGFKQDSSSSYAIALASFSGDDKILADHYAKQERKWRVVMRKFTPSRDYEGLLYNRLMLDTIQDAMRDQRYRSKGGQVTAAQRWGTKEDVAAAKNQLTLVSESPNADALSNSSSLLPIMDKPSLSSRKQRVETNFDPEKFVIKNYMRDWFRGKYPGFTEEDFQYIGEQFSNARETYGARAKDWWASFRTYVNGFMAKTNLVVDLPSKRYNLETGANRNGTRYESTIAERERLAREEDEHLQRLRSGSHGDRTEGSKSLQLPPFTPNTTR